MVYENIPQLLQTPNPVWFGVCTTCPNVERLNPNPKMNIFLEFMPESDGDPFYKT